MANINSKIINLAIFSPQWYDGDAQMRKSSAGALQLGAALRLFPFARAFAVLKRIVFALFTIFMAIGSRGGMFA